jgi:NhaC family Na+:H+ antiporter
LKRFKINVGTPSLAVALLPVLILLLGIISVIVIDGADDVQQASQCFMLISAAVAIAISRIFYSRPWRVILMGISKSWTQIFPAIIVLVLIATVSATWMLSGVVPTLIDYGLIILNPKMFLFIACAVCSVISVLTGSSWTTIATIGVALMGIGVVFGYDTGWIAGAIISGAYFGDKVSPLSDTTVLASSSCGVELFDHIRYLMVTAIPTMSIALIVFLIAGLTNDAENVSHSNEMVQNLQATFNISPWVLTIPIATAIVIMLRIKTTATLALSTVFGLIGIFVFQPEVLAQIEAQSGHSGVIGHIITVFNILITETKLSTGDEMLDSLVTTGGVEGMYSTIRLILCALIFGGALMGTGMLSAITHSFTKRLKGARKTVATTVGSGLFLNCCTGDQYLSIIIGGNMFKNIYRHNRLENRLLSRSLEDSISVTSVLIPWNSCGITQATVLGVATLSYLPYCVFNYVSPLMSIIMVTIGYRIHRRL